MIVFVTLLGIIVSGVSLYEHVAVSAGVNAASFCNVSESINCEAAIRSNWSTLLGIPLGSYGVAFYAFLLLLILFSREEELFPRKRANAVLFALVTCACLYSVFLFLVSKIVIKSFCPFCLATYAINFFLFFLLWRSDREQAWWVRLKSGAAEALGFPMFLMGRKGGSRGRGTAWAGLVAALFVLSLSYALPDFFLNHLLNRNSTDQEVLKRWLNARVEDLEIAPGNVISGDFTFGNENAPVQLVEFSDFECPACRAAYTWLHPLLEKYAGQIFFVYRNFPLDKACNHLLKDDVHKNACFAAQFARCAGEQNKFWSVVDYLSLSYDKSIHLLL